MELIDIPRLIDISAVRADVGLEEIDRIIDVAKQFRFICTFAMPCYTEYLVEALANEADIMVGGVVGFPSGADMTSIKVATARELLAMGVDELDMVINIGALKSGRFDVMSDDIKAVVDAADGKSVKSILEVAYLTDYEIQKGAQLAVDAGVSYVKTGTGWAHMPTTVETIRLIKAAIGDSALIKAAGGVADLDTLLAMVDAGCSRFGIGLGRVITIMDEVRAKSQIAISQ